MDRRNEKQGEKYEKQLKKEGRKNKVRTKDS
jgi:hypothetical protein